MLSFLRRIAKSALATLPVIFLSLLLPMLATAQQPQKDAESTIKKPSFDWPSAWPTQVTEPGANRGGGQAEKALTQEGKTSTQPPSTQPARDDGQKSRSTEKTSVPKMTTDGATKNGASRQSQNELEEKGTKPPEPTELQQQLAKELEAAQRLATRLESVEKAVNRVQDRDDELDQRLPTIDKIISDAVVSANGLRPDLAAIKSQIDRLGPAPTDGKSEAQNISDERKRLNAIYAEVDGAIKSAELTQVRGRQLLARIQEIRLENFRRQLTDRSATVLSPALWHEATTALSTSGKQIGAIFTDWTSRVGTRLGIVVAVLSAALIIGIALHIGGRAVRDRIRGFTREEEATFARRALLASLSAPLRMLPKIVPAAVVFLGLHWLNLLYLQVGGLAEAVFKAIVIAAAGTAFTTSYLLPGRPSWRVINLGDPAAWQVRRLVRFAVYLFALDVLLRSAIHELALPLSVNILGVSLVSLTFAALFFTGTQVQLPLRESSDRPYLVISILIGKAFLVAMGIAVTLSTLSGYVSFGHYLATKSASVGAALFLLAIFYIANRAIAECPQLIEHEPTAAGGMIPLRVQNASARILAIALDVILCVTAIPMLLLSIGVAPNEIAALTNRALYGFEFGGVEVSIVNIGFALGLFAVIFMFTRTLQRWLGRTVLSPTRIEQGIRDSILTGVGYVGFALASIAALSYAGLNITNIALIAGALSVGIGFGLQSIVNNFVSGLILLVERPIRVGDWIRLADAQGYVRKISVRSTEIETFDKASLIIPNSELISGTVVNMTLRNALGRLTIPVGVSYASDPDLVHKLLLEAAEECQLVARHPAPFVVFEGFGDSALDFSLRVYLADVNTSLATQTEVRKLILTKFREVGIEIPFPKRDVRVRDLDALKAILTHRESSNARTSENENTGVDRYAGSDGDTENVH